MVANPLYSMPDALSMSLALAVALFTRMPTLPVAFVLNFGLMFLIVSGCGIAIAEVHQTVQARQQRMVGPVVGGGVDAPLCGRGAERNRGKPFPRCSRRPRRSPR